MNRQSIHKNTEKDWEQYIEEERDTVVAELKGEGYEVAEEGMFISGFWNVILQRGQWWKPYLEAIGFTDVKATAPKNSYGVNDGQLLLDYNGCRAVLWEENRDTYFCPLASTDEDFAEERWPDERFIKFDKLTLSAIVEYLRLMPQITLK